MTVIVEFATPSAMTPVLGERVTEEFATFGTPATKATVLVTPLKPLGVAILKVFVSATVVAIVPVAMPDASVVAAGWVRVFAVPVAAKVTATPLTELP